MRIAFATICAQLKRNRIANMGGDMQQQKGAFELSWYLCLNPCPLAYVPVGCAVRPTMVADVDAKAASNAADAYAFADRG